MDDGSVQYLIVAGLLASGLMAETCGVTLVAQGVNGSKGVVGFVLFEGPEGWPESRDKGAKSGATPARVGNVELKWMGIKPGRYAVVALHDENENKKIDKKASGRPKEGFGISRNPKVGVKAPKFEAAVMEIGCNARVEMQMRYPKKDEEK